jgi:hypothetical protein
MSTTSKPAILDVGLGAVVASGRAGVAAGRVALRPAALALRAPVVGPGLEQIAGALARNGRDAMAGSRDRLGRLVQEALAAPVVEHAADVVLAGPIVDAVGRSVACHQVVERVAAQVLAEADLDRIADGILDDPRTERLVVRVLDSRLLDQLTERVLASPALQRVIEHMAASPEVRAAVAAQSETLAGEIVADVRARSEGADEAIERHVRGWIRRPRPAVS